MTMGIDGELFWDVDLIAILSLFHLFPLLG